MASRDSGPTLERVVFEDVLQQRSLSTELQRGIDPVKRGRAVRARTRASSCVFRETCRDALGSNERGRCDAAPSGTGSHGHPDPLRRGRGSPKQRSPILRCKRLKRPAGQALERKARSNWQRGASARKKERAKIIIVIISRSPSCF